MTAPTTTAVVVEGTTAPAGADAGSTSPGSAGANGQAPIDTGSTVDAPAPETAPKPPGGAPASTRTERIRSSSRDDNAPGDSDPKPAPTEPAADKKPKTEWKVEDVNAVLSQAVQAGELPEGAQRYVEQLRKENGERRNEAKASKAEADAVNDKFTNAVLALTTALGLTPEGDESEAEQVDPEQRLDEMAQMYREKTVELAVYRTAAGVGGDADALLDSRTFLTTVFALDVSADDFTAQVAAAATEAMRTNPKLRAVQEAQPAASGGQFSGGPAEPSTSEWSVDDFRRARRQAQNGLTT